MVGFADAVTMAIGFVLILLLGATLLVNVAILKEIIGITGLLGNGEKEATCENESVVDPQKEESPKASLKPHSLAKKAGLTQRETEVFSLLAKGHGIKFISDSLCISASTSKTHVYNIYRKLNIHTREELIDLVEADEEMRSLYGGPGDISSRRVKILSRLSLWSNDASGEPYIRTSEADKLVAGISEPPVSVNPSSLEKPDQERFRLSGNADVSTEARIGTQFRCRTQRANHLGDLKAEVLDYGCSIERGIVVRQPLLSTANGGRKK